MLLKWIIRLMLFVCIGIPIIIVLVVIGIVGFLVLATIILIALIFSSSFRAWCREQFSASRNRIGLSWRRW